MTAIRARTRPARSAFRALGLGLALPRRWTGPIGAVVLATIAAALIAGPILAIPDPNRIDLGRALAGPSPGHWLGTDHLGRDILSRLLHGGRAAIGLAVPVTIVVAAIGLLVGTVSGYFGGWIDGVVAALLNGLLALPGLVLSLAILALVGPGRGGLFVALIAVRWIGPARIIRGLAIATREAGYVEAARALGATDLQILRRHILPAVVGPAIVLATLDLGTVLLAIATLGFLGLGDQPPAAEWGAMLNDGRPFFRSHPALMILPGACIFLVVLGANLLGDALRDVFDRSGP